MLQKLKTNFSKKVLMASGIGYLVLIVGVMAFCQGFGSKRLVINSTASLPGYLYLVDESRKTLSKGSIVAVNVPENPFTKNTQFLKKIWGLPNDNVTFDKLGNFYINGEKKGRAKRVVAATQEPLIHSKSGVIRPNHYFLATPHKDSYDSRYIYIGNIHEKNIIGDASLIF